MQLVFPVPSTNYEIMVFADDAKTVGIAYDPLSTRPPRSWTSECESCLLDDRSLPLKVRRAVRCLATLVLVARGGFSVKVHTGKKHSHTVWVKQHLGKWHLTIRCRKQKHLKPMKITGSMGTIASQAGSMRKWRGPVLVRAIRMLLGAREASENEITAVLAGLPGDTVEESNHLTNTTPKTLPKRQHTRQAEITEISKISLRHHASPRTSDTLAQAQDLPPRPPRSSTSGI